MKEKKIPFREFKLTKLNEKVLSEMFLYFFLEVAFVGLLANINPFNQPAVEQVKIKTNKKLINVFVPTTPNPTSGFLLMFPIDEVIYLNMTFEEASKFIVSAGTSTGKS